ncbi:unnamed protein product, partial [Adineta steineri]
MAAVVSINDTSRLPENVLELEGEDFYRFTKSISGALLTEVLKVQNIDSVFIFLQTKDIFEIFKYNSITLRDLKSKIGFDVEDGEFQVKHGLKLQYEYLSKLLKLKSDQKYITSSPLTYEKIDILLQRYPFLLSLLNFHENENIINDQHEFLTLFVNTITKNLSSANASRYRYDNKIKSFAVCLYILGGKTTYEYVRLNLPGALPNLTTINSLIQNNDDNLTEGEFRFNKMAKYLNSFGVRHAYCAEDCTGVVRRIKYDTHTNSFIGFSTPLYGGIPSPSHFKTDSITELKLWMDQTEKAPLLNIHCVQPIPPPNQTIAPPSFVLAGYGVSSKYTSLDILRRWLFIHKNSIEKNVRILGFSTDADNKYFRAMRLMAGFYASLSNFDIHVDSCMFSIQTGSWSWFFLRRDQLFVFMQDATHLVTKLRNRLLSATAALKVGNKYITMNHLQELLDNVELTRLDHGLTQSDLKPTDRQNFRSCLRITSCDVLNLIARDDNSNGTYMYLKLIKFIISSYIEPTTSIEERLKGAWTAVFLLRLWWVWLLLVRLSSLPSFSTKSKKHNREQHFVTRTAFFSTELNAHYLTYLILLVQQKQLPADVLNIHLFSSQTCESTFRNTRSLTGVFSTVINYTVEEFLRRSRKLSILNGFKSQEKSTSLLKFPVHHKHISLNTTRNNQNLIDISTLNVENVVMQAYQSAVSIIENLNISSLLKKHKLFDMNALSEYLHNHLRSKSKLHDNLPLFENATDDSDSEFDLDSDDDDDDDNNSVHSKSSGSEGEDDDDDDSMDNEQLKTFKTSFGGLNIKDSVSVEQEKSYFKIKINDT